MTPRVTVLVPAFNDERYLGQALDSIVGQSFRDLEVVVSDDGSADSTVDVAEAWIAKDDRIRLVRNEVNLGMTENWNRALAEARSPLVFKLDADDVLEPDALRLLVESLESDQRIAFAACRTIECDESLTAASPFHGEGALRSAGIDPGQDHRLAGWTLFDLSFDDVQLFHSSSQMYRTDELRAMGGWDTTWSCASDTELLLRLLASDRAVAQIGAVGVRYRRRPSSVSASFSREGWKQVEATLVSLNALQKLGRERARRRSRLRWNWWRLWSNARKLRVEPELWRGMPSRLREKLERAMEQAVPPPLDVRFEGWIRDRLWNLQRPRLG